MNALFFDLTEDSPRVILDPAKGKFEISGESRPENAQVYFAPVLKWLDQFRTILFWQKKEYNKTQDVVFEFKLTYFNSTSAKYLLDILLLLDSLKTEDYPMQVKWYYREQDEDMKSAGEEFGRSLSRLIIDLVPY